MSVPMYYISQHIKCNKRRFRTKPLHTRLTTTWHVMWIRNKRRPVVQWQLWSWRYARMSGADPPAGSRAESVVGGLALSRNRKLFCFWISQEGIFYLTSKFRELRKPHIFQVMSD